MSAKIIQTASAGVCVSARAWNYGRERERERGCWRGLVYQPIRSLLSHPVYLIFMLHRNRGTDALV